MTTELDQLTTFMAQLQKSRMEYKVPDVGRYSKDLIFVHMLINGKRLSMELGREEKEEALAVVTHPQEERMAQQL